MELFDTGLERSSVIRETEKAYLFAVAQGVTGFARDREVWVPKSQVSWIAPGHFHESAHVPSWLLRKINRGY